MSLNGGEQRQNSETPVRISAAGSVGAMLKPLPRSIGLSSTVWSAMPSAASNEIGTGKSPNGVNNFSERTSPDSDGMAE